MAEIDFEELIASGYIARRAGDRAKAKQIFSQAVEALSRAGSGSQQDLLARARCGLGQIESDLGNREAALRQYQEALAIDRALGDPDAIASSSRHAAELLVVLERPGEAAPLIDESLRIVRADPETGELLLANTVRVAARVQAALKQPEAARALWTEARALYKSCEIDAGVAECDRRIAAL